MDRPPDPPARSRAWMLDELAGAARWPLRILLTGGALGAVASLPGMPDLSALSRGGPTLVALLLFAVGLGFAGFLWWLATRSLALLGDPTVPAERQVAQPGEPLGGHRGVAQQGEAAGREPP